MFSESSMFLHNPAADRRCTNDGEEQIDTVHRLLAVALSLVIAGGTAFAVAMPFALLHLR